MSDGADFRFYDEKGKELPSELDTWNPSGVSSFWVRVDELKPGLTLTMRYGLAEDPGTDSQQVWSAYTGVWHMNMDAAKTTVAESAHGYDGEVWNPEVAQVAAGMIGNAYWNPAQAATVGRRACVAVTNATALTAFNSFSGEVTISAWIKDEGSGTRYGRIWNTAGGNISGPSNKGGSDFAIEASAARISAADDGTRAASILLPSRVDKWSQVVLTYRDGRRHVYLNGAEVAAFDNGAAAYSAREDAAWTFGARSRGDEWNSEQWSGCLDEIRAFPGTTSVARVTAEYEMVTKGIGYLSFRRQISPSELATFKRFVRLTVKGYSGEPLDDFRLLVRLPGTGRSGFHPADSVNSGNDVRFFLEDGTLLPSELDTWNPSGESLYWVRVPQLKAGLTLVMRYGSSLFGPRDARNVWDDYTGVWHMNMNAAKTTVAESAHGYDGTVRNVDMVQVAAGPLGNAYRHPNKASETTGYMAGIVVNGAAAIDAFSKFSGDVTLSAWVKSEYSLWGRIWNTANGQTPSATGSCKVGSEVSFEGNATHLSVSDSGTRAASITVPSLEGWTQVVLTYRDGHRHVYLNGAEVTAFDNGEASYSAYNRAPWIFGAKATSLTSSPNDGQWVGCLDEIRAYPGSTSTARIQAEYEMMASGTGYLTIDEVLPTWSTDDLATFAYYSDIDVSGYAGTEALTNFPLAVRVSSATMRGFKASRMRADGRDALFVLPSGEQLAMEVDTCDPAGESVYWVRIPCLTNGTKVVFYHGRTEAVFEGTGDGVVWPGYAGVWHVNETTDGAVPLHDSSALPITTTGGQNSKATVTGVFGGARGSTSNGATGPSAFSTVNDNKLNLGSRFTVSTWVRRADALSNYCYLLGRKHWDGDGAWAIQSRHPNVYWWGMWLNGDRSKSPVNMYTMTVDVDTWHKLDFIYDGTDQYIYFDGEQVAHQVSETTALQGSIGFAAGGAHPGTFALGSGAFPGDMDEVRYDGAVRSADWIKAEYQNAGIGGQMFLTYGRDRKTVPEGMILLAR